MVSNTYLQVNCSKQTIVKGNVIVCWQARLTAEITVCSDHAGELSASKIQVLYTAGKDEFKLLSAQTVVDDKVIFDFCPLKLGEIRFTFKIFLPDSSVLEEHEITVISPFTGKSDSNEWDLEYDGLITYPSLEHIVKLVKDAKDHQLILLHGHLCSGKSTTWRRIIKKIDDISSSEQIALVKLEYKELQKIYDMKTDKRIQIQIEIWRYLEKSILEACFDLYKKQYSDSQQCPELSDREKWTEPLSTEDYEDCFHFTYLKHKISDINLNINTIVIAFDEIDRMTQKSKETTDQFLKILMKGVLNKLDIIWSQSRDSYGVKGIIVMTDWSKERQEIMDRHRSISKTIHKLEFFDLSQIKNLMELGFGEKIFSNHFDAIADCVKENTAGNPLLVNIMLHLLLQEYLSKGWAWSQDVLGRVKDHDLMKKAMSHLHEKALGPLGDIPRLLSEECKLYRRIKTDSDPLVYQELPEDTKKCAQSLQQKGLIIIDDKTIKLKSLLLKENDTNCNEYIVN